MPQDRLPPTAAAPTRRALVTTGALLALSACSDGGIDGPVLPVDPVADPDVALAVEAWTAETRLLRQLRAAQRRHPRLRTRLEPVRRAHAAHARVLAGAVPADDLPRVDSPAVPAGRPAALLRALVRAEEGLARGQAGRAGRALSGPLARVLASAAAAAVQHARLLSEEGT